MVQCPKCQHEMQLKGAKRGQLFPTCPRCATRFTVVIEREGAEPVVVPEGNVTMPPAPPVSAATGRTRRPASQTVAPDPLDVAPDPAPSTPSTRATVRPTTSRPGTEPDAASWQDNAPKVYQQSTGRMPGAGSTSTSQTGRLGGYELKRKLGQGGMGTVYLARQVSLDRDVAVKVLDSGLSRDEQFVARFVREAYAAAQLVHHNVVQIHDIGEEEQSHFYSMEYVKGRSLADLIRNDGAIAPDTAAGYILQAARGLKLAHDQGMVHRDIKPENLLLSEAGIVKVADLGLVKRIGDAPDSTGGSAAAPADAGSTMAGATMARTSMGTPAYMAPEQAADAASVDMRADIYSLGCTLFALLTGRPPFEGPTAEAIMALAAKSEVPSPMRYNKHVPSELARICRKMTAKKREGRYPNINLVIRDLERYLGVDPAGDFTPRQQHVADLERAVKAYNDSNLATLRKVLYMGSGFFGLVIASSLGWAGQWWLAAGAIGLILGTFLCYQVLVELSGRRYFLGRIRQAIAMLTWRQWVRAGMVLTLLVLAVIAMGIILPTLGVAALSIVLALTARLTVDRFVTRQRHGSFSQAEAMLQGLRVQGMDEESIRRFVCEYSGHYWEEFYEEMFGYEAKMDARKRWGRTLRGHLRPKFASWRDPFIAWIDKRVEAQKAERQRKLLLNAEIKALRAQGMDELAAGKEAKRRTEIVLSQAAGIREDALRYRDDPASTIPTDPAKQTAVQRVRETFDMNLDGERVTFKGSSYLERRYGGPLDWIFGPPIRFAMAAILLFGFLVWQGSNRTAAENEARKMLGERVDPTVLVQQNPAAAIGTQRTLDEKKVVYTELRETLPWLPNWYCDAAGSWNGGAAGAVLLISSFVPGIGIAIPIYLSALIMLFGHRTPLGQIPIGRPEMVSLVMGTSLAFLTFAFSRRGD